MSNKLIQLLRESDEHRLIVRKLSQNLNIGHLKNKDDEAQPLPLSSDLVDHMNGVVKVITEAVIELNKKFIAKNITASSSEEYAKFLCDLIPEFIMLPTYEELEGMNGLEIETLADLQMKEVSIEEMRYGLAENNFLKQSELTKEQVLERFKELDDGTIKEAYKTLLVIQYNKAIQPQ